jgi:hypothetical protein
VDDHVAFGDQLVDEELVEDASEDDFEARVTLQGVEIATCARGQVVEVANVIR